MSILFYILLDYGIVQGGYKKNIIRYLEDAIGVYKEKGGQKNISRADMLWRYRRKLKKKLQKQDKQ